MPRKLLSSLAILPTFAAITLAIPPTERPLPPREAAAAMTVPPGFKVTLFAGEPDVTQPIAMCFDDRGRLWVAECHSYPKWIKDGRPGEDKILIFEDTDNDGQFDKRTVFLDKLANLSSIEFGFGGIYALTAPYLIHIPMDPKTDRPTGPPVKLLDGWNLDIQHNIVNGLKWGPDGWLYGCHGILATSYAGKPGTPKEQRPPLNCGVWRFHPVNHKYEVVAHGGTNPWGIDWDEQGELYFTNCVIDHAFHVIPGGHYQRMYGTDFNPHLYKLMGSACDHIHWGGGAWTSSRGGEGKHSEAGGGHAHSGCMIYLGDNFPPEYRNNLFAGNIHGNRLNRDRIDYTQSGPVLRHEKDFLFANDPWFRPLAMTYGPDGGVYVIDWTDTGECHNYEVAHKSSGRIYKVVYGQPKDKARDLATLTNKEITQLHSSSNEWLVRHARRIVQERYLEKKIGFDEFGGEAVFARWRPQIKGNVASADDDTKAARFAAFNRARTLLAIDEWRDRWKDEALRDMKQAHPLELKFLIQAAFENFDLAKRPALRKTIEDLAPSHPPYWAQLKLAAGLNRLAPSDRWLLAGSILENTNAQDDPNIPYLLWYAVESLPELDVSRSVALLEKARIPLVREFLARRIATLPDAKAKSSGLDLLVSLASKTDVAVSRDILVGVLASLQGQRSAARPKTWDDAYPLLQRSPHDKVVDLSTSLAVIFGDERALKQLRSLVKDFNVELPRRQDALKSLVFKQSADLRGLLEELLDDGALRSPAIRALAGFSDDKIAPRLIGLYPRLSSSQRDDARATLASRPAFALALLAAVDDKKIERTELSLVEVRQMLALKDAKVTARVEEVWGSIRPASKEKSTQLAKYKKLLAAEELKKADHAQGRLLYTKHCAACHKLFGEGGAIGPDITGSQRANLDYILENLIDPNAVVPREYQVTIFTTASGRTISGLVKEESDRAVSIQTQNEIVVLPKSEIEQRTASKQSMMPEGMLEHLSIAEIRALVAYLSRSTPLEKK